MRIKWTILHLLLLAVGVYRKLQDNLLSIDIRKDSLKIGSYYRLSD